MLSEDECVALDSSLTEETNSNEEQARFDIACEDYSNRTWLKNSPLSVKFQLLVVTLRPHHDNIGFFTFQNWLGIYMQGSLGFSVSDTGAYFVPPWFMTALVAYFGGKFCQKAIRDFQTPPWKTRQIAMTVSDHDPRLWLPPLGVLLPRALLHASLRRRKHPNLSVTIIAIIVGAQAASVAGVHAYLQDYALRPMLELVLSVHQHTPGDLQLSRRQQSHRQMGRRERESRVRQSLSRIGVYVRLLRMRLDSEHERR